MPKTPSATASLDSLTTLLVDLGERSYPIHIGSGLLQNADLLAQHLPGQGIAVVTNTTVGPLYGPALRTALGRPVTWIELPDGEVYKTLDSLELILTRMLEARLDRGATVIALGGGVVGDLAGFAAAVYQRGVHFLQIPTTLLAQVDSSVGGKTGVNHPLGKNMIGAFHQPRAVWIDLTTLHTLPPRELCAGLAEIIKYGLIEAGDFFSWLEEHLDALLALDETALRHAIQRSCTCKAAIVAADEREAGRRALLNLGHTFGHAIEAGMGYGAWLHGEAVGTGMAMAARLSERLGWLSTAERMRTEALLVRAGHALYPPDRLTPEHFHRLMAIDKKNRAGRLRLVLLRAIGDAVVTEDFPMAELDAILADTRPDARPRLAPPVEPIY
jgi:3-dehydroquinate synthase